MGRAFALAALVWSAGLVPARGASVGSLNATIPPDAAPVVKTADLKGSAVGPGFTLIPLPAFTYNRNEGSWIGALTPIFRANDRGEVEDIFAPLYLHNDLIGETFTFNYFGYRRETRQYHLILSHATRIEHVVDLSYKDTALRDGRYLILLQANTGKSAFNRFYGLGPNTRESSENQFTMGDANIVLGGGLNLSNTTSLIARQRYRDVNLENGASRSLPQALETFSTVPGIEGANVVGQGLLLSYDTRDNQLTPLDGVLATALAEYNQNVQFTERNHWWRVTGEARQFLPHADDRMVFVWHALLDAVVGQDENTSVDERLVRRGVPFFERPSLGGETTLRGFGRGRFVSNTAWLVNLEERFYLVRQQIMGNMIELEVAPFVDIGRVGRTLATQSLGSRVQVNPGAGLRLLARPNIAGRLDVGYGRDGANVFVGLDYPF